MSVPSIRLSELMQQVEGVIHRSFGSNYFWVIAEVSGHKYYPNNDRHYLDLIEKVEGSTTEAAKVKAKAWIEGSRNIANFENSTGQKFTNGLSVLVKIKIEYHIVHGLSVTIYDIDPAFTLGNIARQRQQVLQMLLASEAEHIKLVNGDYITRNKGLVLPVVLQKIALIASPNSEGYTDFMHTLTSNNQGYKFNIDIYYSSVQGKDAENELVQTFLKIHASGSAYDCVVLIRGGGARTDFLVFDTYSLSRIVARFPIPVITGIGHHNDVSIVDMMANTSTKTPTQSAEFILDCNRRFESELKNLRHLVTIRAQQSLKQNLSSLVQLQNIVGNRSMLMFKKFSNNLIDIRHGLQLSSLSRIASHTHVIRQLKSDLLSESLTKLKNEKAEVIGLAEYIRTASQKLVNRRKEQVDQFASLMKMADPSKVLKRGFAIIRKSGHIMATSSDIKVNEELEIEMDQSLIKATVVSNEIKDGYKTEL